MLLLSVFPAFSAEVLENFDAAIKINEDSSLSVTENITAKVENINISRGIIRAFPVEYEDKNGRSVTVGFDVEDVLLDGAPVPWEVSDSGRYKALRIGDPSKIIPRGLHTFTIKYRTTRQIGFYENYDELYWNVTGNQWTFPIIHSTVKVSLPNLPYGEGFSSAEWYVGAYGEKGSPNDAKLGKSRSISITRPLMPGEGYTAVYTWPKGIVTPPPPPREDNEKAHVIIGALTLISMAGWFAFAWRKWGKDPSRKAVIPIFSPPGGESPSFLRFARDLKSDKTAFTASILNLAVRGALTIEEEKGEDGFFSKGKSTFILHAKDKSPEKLKPEEDAVMMHLFPGGADTLVLTNDSAEQISDALAGLRGVMRRRTKELYSDNAVKCLPGVLIYAAGTAALYPFSGEYPLNFTLCGICGAVMIFIGMRKTKKAANSGGQKTAQFIGRIAPPVLIGLIASVTLIDSDRAPFTFILFTLSAAIISVMKPLMGARTEKGNEMLNAALGLTLYMTTAEKERLEMFNPPTETPELFEKLMPYALALDAANTWGSKFEKILTDADYKPTWYTGPGTYGMFLYGSGMGSFYNSFAENISESLISETTISAPGTSSGFGGGGFSGGGGVGGGGSGW